MTDRVPTLETGRVSLRAWRDGDRAPFAAMNADPRVMEHFPETMTGAQTDDQMERIIDGWRRGYGLWAAEERRTGNFIGFVGLSSPTWEAPFTPCIEIGWRLCFDAWGHGYATEAAQHVVEWARTHVEAPNAQLVSFTTLANERSRRVMEKLGFTHDDGDNFDHPALAQWELRRMVLYRLKL
jgi:ribosomal-protein-alanine N-acetyltransferase